MIAAASTPDLTYSWAQALNDLGQVSAITALIGFMLFAIVAELALPRSRRDGVVAMVAVTGFAYSLGTAGYRWINGLGGPAYHGYATGDSFALFFEILFAVLGILTVAVSHPYLQKRGLREGEFHILIMAAVIGMMVLGSAASRARSCSTAWRSCTARRGPRSSPTSPRACPRRPPATRCWFWASCSWAWDLRSRCPPRRSTCGRQTCIRARPSR